MTDPHGGPSFEDRPRDRTTTYVAVLLVEAAVIAALWAFGSYFSA